MRIKIDDKLKRSIELDNAAKPGDTYEDPVWGTVHVPDDAQYCHDPRHETPCKLPCAACEDECNH